MTIDARRTTRGDNSVTYHLALTDEQWAAWNVRESLGMDAERVAGDARIRPFTVTQAKANRDLLKADMNVKSGGRWTPPGDYVMLEVRGERNTSTGMNPDEWDCMMSDTPDEANDHAEAIYAAWLGGTVLIHGLGLGCYLNTVLACPDVEHVDVVEISKDVIDLTGPYFQSYVDEGRLTIHHDNALTKVWPKNSYWNIVWHDVWQHIAAYNLTDTEEAEHGVTYEAMHRKFGHRCDWQGSWGFRQARWMRKKERELERKAEEFVLRWNYSTPERRLELLAGATMPHLAPEAWLEFLKMNAEMGHPEMWDNYNRMAQSTIDVDTARHALDR